MRRRRIALIVVGCVILAVGAGAIAWALSRSSAHSIAGSASTEFVTTAGPESKPRPKKLIETVPWPTYGLDNQRTRFAGDFRLRPPFRRVWRYRAGSLIEFPPPIAYGALYVPVERGFVDALDAKTGKRLWRHHYRACIAATPAVDQGLVFVAMMNPCKQPHDGRPGLLVALSARTGHEVWRFDLGATESSPLVVNGVVYVGSRDHRLYALKARTGKLLWSYDTGGEIKSAPAYVAGTVFVGAYNGYLYAIDARTGRLRWRAASEKVVLRGRGGFYANPAIAYGRIFIGNTDGAVYAFGATRGALLWARKTGGYVYGSAAIWNQTIYVGSYDHTFYALDAATGAVKWKFKANGPISGSATVMDGIVYFSTLAERTYGLDARTGRVVWTFKDGQYSPLVAQSGLAFLVGRGSIYALAPRK
jgi:outer membrane protein assembly factor BamB